MTDSRFGQAYHFDGPLPDSDWDGKSYLAIMLLKGHILRHVLIALGIDIHKVDPYQIGPDGIDVVHLPAHIANKASTPALTIFRFSIAAIEKFPQLADLPFRAAFPKPIGPKGADKPWAPPFKEVAP